MAGTAWEGMGRPEEKIEMIKIDFLESQERKMRWHVQK